VVTLAESNQAERKDCFQQAGHEVTLIVSLVNFGQELLAKSRTNKRDGRLMGKRLRKKELLAEIATERTRLMELVESISKRQFNLPGINSADWSIKDVLTHLLDWETRVVNWCEVGQRGEVLDMPGDGFKWNQLKDLNALIQKRHSRKSIKRVLEEFDAAHEKTQALIRGLNDKQLTTIGYFDWTGKSWTLSDYLRGNTASHYKWARTKIRKWLAKLD
jgi:hypothetical protein